MDLLSLLPFLLILVFFWLLVVRPARNRQRAQAQMQSQLSPGQRVMLTSGLFATIAAVEDDAVVLETAPGVTSRWAKPAVSRILPDESVDEAARRDETDRPADPPDGRSDDVTPPTA